MRRRDSYQVANHVKRANRVLQIVLILSFIAGLNFIAGRHFLRFDLSEDTRYALSPETRAMLQELTQPVQVVVTIPRSSTRPGEEALFPYVNRLLQEYAYHSRKPSGFMVQPEYVDIYRELARADTLARDFGLTDANSILVVGGDRRRLIRPDEIITFAQRKPTAYTGEAALTSAIMEVTQEKSPVLYFLQGHQEARPGDTSPQSGLSQIAREMQMRNFTLAPLDLSAAPGVPADAAVLVIADPKGPLLPSEVDKIRSWLLERAGRVLLWTRPGVNLGMDSLLAEWGLLLPDQLVIEPDPGYREASGTLLLRNFGEHPITGSLIENQTYVLSGLARPVFPRPPTPPDERLRFLPLLATSSQSWAEIAYLTRGEPVFDPASDTPGPVPVAVATERRASDHLGIKVPGGRLVVFGSPDLFSNQRVSSLGNFSLFFNTLNWMLDRDRMLVIPPRPADSYQIALGQRQLRHIGLLFLIIPAALGIAGMLVYWIRKA